MRGGTSQPLAHPPDQGTAKAACPLATGSDSPERIHVLLHGVAPLPYPSVCCFGGMVLIQE